MRHRGGGGGSARKLLVCDSLMLLLLLSLPISTLLQDARGALTPARSSKQHALRAGSSAT